MTPHGEQPLEPAIAQWRAYVSRRRSLRRADVEELEAHLRDQLAALTDSGLAPDEAFLVAVRRMGSIDALSREFARAHAERLWKQLALTPDGDADPQPGARLEAIVVCVLAVAAAVTVKAPALFGVTLQDHGSLYARNASLFVLPWLTAYFTWKRQLPPWLRAAMAVPFVAGAAAMNAFPFTSGSHTSSLSALHLPIALWLVVGLAYTGGRWLHDNGRMDFVRFTGELFIYYVLIALGGIVLTACTMMMFDAIGMDPAWMAQDWLVPCGAAGAILVASWLVEAKQSVVENMAPVLTRLFTPLFTVLLLTFLLTMAWTGRPIDIKREVLIAFDLLLVLVASLVLYAMSARNPDAPAGPFDGLQLLLIVSALVVDLVALAAIASRISEFGFTPNRVAALGENLILLANLAWSARLYAGFIRGHTPFRALEAWQMAYLPVYAVWAALVVLLFPPLFGFA